MIIVYIINYYVLFPWSNHHLRENPPIEPMACTDNNQRIINYYRCYIGFLIDANNWLRNRTIHNNTYTLLIYA